MNTIDNITGIVGNWASKLYHETHYCGWMDLHVDEPDEGYKNGIWTIRVVEADKDAVFVHKKNGLFVLEELHPEKEISFRYDRMHGLLPRAIGKSLEGKRRWNQCREYIEWMKKEMPDTFYRGVSKEQNKVRIIWEFIDEDYN